MASEKPLLSFYGDDLTGSTDAMEALEFGGVKTVLFVDTPDAALLDRFGHCKAFGLAGTSRSETPAWMDEHLPPAFAFLKSLGAEICHYKVCSTFDSSPAIGNIGRALEIGREVFGGGAVPLLVGTPQLGRYTAFGNLFANFRGTVYRIDRHPVMSRHPVTPMAEADLLVHLSRQTVLRSALLDLAASRAPDADARLDALLEAHDIVMLDVDDPETQALAGRQLWRVRRPGGRFVVGASGVEYALPRAWRGEGLAPGTASFEPAGPVDRIAVVSGSVSPTTERQIAMAASAGFATLALDPVALVTDGDMAVAAAVAAGNAELSAGRSVILYTAMGPGADRGAEIDAIPGARHRLGRMLGQILSRLVRDQRLTRAIIAGGDTSSHALRQLDIQALTVRMPLPRTPGSPLCVAHSVDPSVDGLEIALKGGQLGGDTYFEDLRRGHAG
jgi:uncharacterized protein YgbK (DUF1537 family)